MKTLANTVEAADLPAFTELARRSIVFDAAGNQIDIFKAENREPFKISQVPKDVVDADAPKACKLETYEATPTYEM